MLTVVMELKFVQDAPRHLSIWKPVSSDEVSCHCRAMELVERATALKLIGALGTLPAKANFALPMVARSTAKATAKTKTRPKSKVLRPLILEFTDNLFADPTLRT